MAEIQTSPVKSELTIVQRAMGVRFAFGIGDDGVKYRARERLVTREAFIPYEALNPNRQDSVKLAGSPLLRNLFGLGLLYLLMAAAFGAVAVYLSIILIAASAFVFIAAVVGRLTGWTDLNLTMLPLVGAAPGAWGPVKIIDNRKGAKILEAIRTAWCAKLKRLYGEADLSADAAKEISRLTWLRDNHVLTEEEWESQVGRVKEATLQLASASDLTH